MLATLREKQSFDSNDSDKDMFSEKQKASTKNASSCKTIESDFNDQSTIGNLQKIKSHSLLINNLMERIKKMEKAQNQAKQKFEICISKLTKQIGVKDVQNKKISDEIQSLRGEIAQQMRDLETIKVYASKVGSKTVYLTNQKKTKEEKKKSPIKQNQCQGKGKVLQKSRGKLFRKAAIVN